MKSLVEQGQLGWDWAIAETYNALGNKEEALLWFEKSHESRQAQTGKLALAEFLWWLSNADYAASLRDEPRIQAILEKG